MILFGLYSGQRLGDVATLRWNNLDLLRNELRLSTRKTGKTMILPLAATLRKHIASLDVTDDPAAPIHPRAFDLVERQHKTGNLSNQFADLLAAAGLREKKNHKSAGKGRASRRDVEPLSFHSLRRTATTMLHEAGVPAAVAQALIGTIAKRCMSFMYRLVATRSRRQLRLFLRSKCVAADRDSTILSIPGSLTNASRHRSRALAYS